MKILFIYRPFIILGGILLSVSASGCSLFGSSADGVKITTQPAFTECLKVCYDSDTRMRNSYTSCLDGCGRAAAGYPLSGETFADLERCEEGITELRAEAPKSICNDLARDLRRKQGCEEGVSNFYRVIAAYSACESVNAAESNILAAPGQGAPADGHVTSQDLSN